MISTIFKLLSWTKGYHQRIYLGVVCSICQTWCTAIPIISAAWIINKILLDYDGLEKLDGNHIWLAFSVIIISVLFRFLFSYWKALLQESIGTEICAKERIEIGDFLKRVSLGYFNQNRTGDILNTITNDLSQLELQATKMIDAILNGYANLLATIFMMAIFCWQAALLATIGTLLSFILLEASNHHSKKMAPILNQATNDLSSAILEYINGLQVVKSYGQQGIAILNLNQSCRKSKNIHIKINQVFTLYNCFHSFIIKSTEIGIVFIATFFTFQQSLTVSMFIMISMFVFMLFGGIEKLIDISYILSVLDNAILKLKQMKESPIIDQGGKGIALNNFDIQFKDVTFAYENQDVLKNITFLIPEGSQTAIIGPSGSGKTTICSLIARFYDVKSGQICIGGHDLREMKCDSLLQNISMVFQDVYLFKDTIYNNIKFGNPNATKEKVIQAAKLAQCHDFIMSLPHGYDTYVNEGGSSLSGGEKQRISIARAILKNAPVIILDEATASIDPENEQLIQNAITKLIQGKTTIIIAHRLATIEHANQILVIDDGMLVQCGKHQALIQEEGIYKSFVQIRERSEGWKLN